MSLSNQTFGFSFLWTEYLNAGNKVLFIDDFLANGNASKGIIDLVNRIDQCRRHNSIVSLLDTFICRAQNLLSIL